MLSFGFQICQAKLYRPSEHLECSVCKPPQPPDIKIVKRLPTFSAMLILEILCDAKKNCSVPLCNLLTITPILPKTQRQKKSTCHNLKKLCPTPGSRYKLENVKQHQGKRHHLHSKGLVTNGKLSGVLVDGCESWTSMGIL